jgi:hypothetical protein
MRKALVEGPPVLLIDKTSARATSRTHSFRRHSVHLSFDLFYALTAVDAISEATTCLIEKTIINPGASSPPHSTILLPPCRGNGLVHGCHRARSYVAPSY